MRDTYRSNTMNREVKSHTCIPHHQTFTDISFFLFFFFLRWHALGSEVSYHDSGLLFRLGYFLPQCHFKKSCFGLSRGAWTRADTMIEM